MYIYNFFITLGRTLLIVSFLSGFLINAHGQKKKRTESAAVPHVFVYKTKSDYRNLVPVNLTPDKSKVAYYPDPKDIPEDISAAMPAKLADGYLLSRNGISKDVAFLKLTYAQYSKLSAAPSAPEILTLIADNDPLVTLCDCGPRNKFHDAESEINKMIADFTLMDKCKVMLHKSLWRSDK